MERLLKVLDEDPATMITLIIFLGSILGSLLVIVTTLFFFRNRK